MLTTAATDGRIPLRSDQIIDDLRAVLSTRRVLVVSTLPDLS